MDSASFERRPLPRRARPPRAAGWRPLLPKRVHLRCDHRRERRSVRENASPARKVHTGRAPSATVVDRKRLFRRGFHALTSLFVVYWWFPERVVELDLTRQQVAVVGLALLASFEAYRIHKGWLFFGLREYERKHIAGYFWGASGYVVALLFFEQRFAMLTILGTTLVDPLLGEMRAGPWKKWGPPAGFGAWCAIAIACVAFVPLSTPVYLIPLGAALAVAAEAVKMRPIDDNLVMNIVPLLSLTALAAILGL